jgi:hypothetical protein
MLAAGRSIGEVCQPGGHDSRVPVYYKPKLGVSLEAELVTRKQLVNAACYPGRHSIQ